ncbi:penicillin-binding protein 2, partial [Halomonas sp. SUBG004]
YWQVTPLQLASATAALANRGHWVKPRLALRIGEQPVPEELPGTLPDIELANDNWWDRVYSGMEKVLSGSEGTARRTGVGLEYRMGASQARPRCSRLVKISAITRKSSKSAYVITRFSWRLRPSTTHKIAVSVIVEKRGGGGSTHAAHFGTGR